MIDNIFNVSKMVVATTGCSLASITGIRYNRGFKTAVITTSDGLMIVCWNVRYPEQCTDIFDEKDNLKIIKKYIGVHGFTQKKVVWILDISQATVSLIMRKNGIEKKGDH